MNHAVRFATALVTLCGVAAAEPPSENAPPAAGGVQAPLNAPAPQSAAPQMSSAVAAAWRMGILSGGRVSMPQSALRRDSDRAAAISMGATSKWAREAAAEARSIQSNGSENRRTVVHHGQALNADGSAAHRESMRVMNGATRTRRQVTTLPDGSKVTREDAWTAEGGVVTHTGARTGRHGNVSNLYAEYSREGDTVTREAARELASGETVKSTDTWTKDGDTVVHEGKSESSSGKSAHRSSKAQRSGNTVSREAQRTGFNGRATSSNKAVTRDRLKGAQTAKRPAK